MLQSMGLQRVGYKYIKREQLSFLGLGQDTLYKREDNKCGLKVKMCFSKFFIITHLGSPVVKTLSSKARGVGLIPGLGAQIPHASQPKNQNIKQKQYCNTFNKDCQNGSLKKKKKKLKKIVAHLRSPFQTLLSLLASLTPMKFCSTGILCSCLCSVVQIFPL